MTEEKLRVCLERMKESGWAVLDPPETKTAAEIRLTLKLCGTIMLLATASMEEYLDGQKDGEK